MTRKVIFGALLLVIAFLAYDFFLKPPSFKRGAPVPAFNANLINGESFSINSLEGNYVLIDFWGSWCAPCRKEMPMMKDLYSTYHDREYKNAENFHIVSIALEKSDALTRRIIEKENLNWDYHIIDVSRIVMMSKLAQKFDVKELPTKFFVSPAGEIIGTNLSFQEISEILDKQL